MKRIDTHQHFWRYNEAEFGWIDDDRLKRDFLPDDLEPLIRQEGIEGAIAVQARQTLDETEWLLQLAGSHSFIKGVVGWIDLCSDIVREQLQRLSSHPRLKGVRHVLHDEPDDRFMLKPEFIRGLGCLKEFGLTYDILIFPKHLTYACELVSQFPEQLFVLDHIAKPFINDKILAPWDEHIRQLAAYPNVYCKVSGMVSEADRAGWKYDDFLPYLDVVTEAFGTKRIITGSDWPVCAHSSDYAKTMSIPKRYFESFSTSEQEDVWYNNAVRFYGV